MGEFSFEMSEAWICFFKIVQPQSTLFNVLIGPNHSDLFLIKILPILQSDLEWTLVNIFYSWLLLISFIF